MSGSSGGGSKSSSSTQPPAYLQPYLKQAAGDAQKLYQGTGPQYYPNSTVANQSGATTGAIQGTITRATNGSPINQAAGGYLTDVLNGKYLNAGNPNQGAVWNSVASQVLPAVDSQFSLLGRYGSGAQANAAATGLTNAFAPYAFSNYQSERADQQAAAQMAPTQANQDYVDLGQMANAGSTQDNYAQSLINDQINRWDYNQNLPQQKLQTYLAELQGGNFGSNSITKETPVGSGAGLYAASALGGLLGSVL